MGRKIVAKRAGAGREVIGIIPAAGFSRRIARIPCSKEIYPVGFWRIPGTEEIRPKTASHYLLEKMRMAGITKVFVVLRKEKWDIPAYMGTGDQFGVHLAYVVIESSLGPPFTLDYAYPFTQGSIVAFGFPDIIFETDDAFVQLLKRQEQTGADIVLGLFSIDQARQDDRVGLTRDGRVCEFVPGPSSCRLPHTWNVAVWQSSFTEFMHDYLAIVRPQHAADAKQMKASRKEELTVGGVFKAAFEKGLKIDGVIFPNDPYIDIGTPLDMAQAVKRYADTGIS
jgi:glucose-1-phosphate thymidylyltransferase